MIKEKINLSQLGQEMLSFAINHIQETKSKLGYVRTKIFYPLDEFTFAYIELSKIIDDLLGKFDVSPPFSNKNSEYFHAIKDTALHILRIKISDISPNHYIFISPVESSKVQFIIRDPDSFGISKMDFLWKNNQFVPDKIETLPSNVYTNPMNPFQA